MVNSPDPMGTVKVVGSMKNVMWQGQLGVRIDLDTIADKTGLYGLGPLTGLTGELLINDGRTYISRVTSDTTMSVEVGGPSGAPFFVYANVTDWREVPLPPTVTSIAELETFIDKQTRNQARPFAFKLVGTVTSANIHVQNLPPGTPVSSPKEAHQGQASYSVADEAVEIIGFFSTEHQGVFTHHDSFLHMHLLTAAGDRMGHLDGLVPGGMRLFLPE